MSSNANLPLKCEGCPCAKYMIPLGNGSFVCQATSCPSSRQAYHLKLAKKKLDFAIGYLNCRFPVSVEHTTMRIYLDEIKELLDGIDAKTLDIGERSDT